MLPSEPEAERALLGACLLNDRDRLAEVLPMLSPDDFYDPVHGHIWTALAEAYQTNRACDPLTVSAIMRAGGSLGALQAREGVAYLVELSATVVYVSSAVDYAKLVKEASTQRRLTLLCSQIQEAAKTRSRPASENLADLQRQAEELAGRAIPQPPRKLKTLIHSAIDNLRERTEAKRAIVGVPSGLEALDGMTAGFRRGSLVIVAARPSMGKTALVVNALLNAAQLGFPGLFFSLEMGGDEIVERCIALDGRITSTRLQNGFLEGKDWVRIYGSADRMSPLPLYIDDCGSQTLATITAKARRWKRGTELFPKGDELGLIAIDYLQLISSPSGGSKFTNRDREIAVITQGLKALAKELRVPVVVLSQLNRSLENRAEKRPQMSDLRESGSIEQDADLICFIYRDEQYDKNSKEKGIAEIIVGKQRTGPTGTARVAFIADETRFANLSYRRDY